MSEPTTTTVAVSLGTVTVTGSLLGCQYDALLMGAAGVLFGLRMLPPMRAGVLVASVVSTTVLAAVASPVLAAWVCSLLPSLQTVAEGVRLTSAMLLGASAQWLLPAALDALKAKLLGGSQ